MNFWIEFMPLCFVRLLATKMERSRVGSRWFHNPRPGVLIEVEEKSISGPMILRLA